MAVVMRELVLPHMGASINGHMEGDPQVYQTLAQAQLERVRSNGWQGFELRLQGHGPAGIASALYLVWNNPYSVVIANMLLHGISAVAIALILMQWFSPTIAVVSTLPLVLSPYMMLWFSQLNKESYALAGMLLYTLGMLKLLDTKCYASWRAPIPAVLTTLAGIALLWTVRPYVNQMLLPVSALGFFVATLVWLYRGQVGFRQFAAAAVVVLGPLRLAGTGAASDITLRSFNNFSSIGLTNDSEIIIDPGIVNNCLRTVDVQNWHDSDLLPDFVNNKLTAIAGQRCLIFTILQNQTNESTLDSFVDQHILPNGSLKMLAYAPRAAALGILAPWPDRWFSTFTVRPSIFYSIASIEAFMAYLGLVGIVIWLAYGGNRGILIPIAMALPIMTIFGLATPFIGALYRYRYPWWMLLLCLGLAATVDLWCRRRVNRQTVVIGDKN
jgi:hypothetical protein